MMSLEAIKEIIPNLSRDERKELLNLLLDTFVEPSAPVPADKKRSLRELRGLGKHIWEGIDVQDYINQQRDEWDRPS